MSPVTSKASNATWELGKVSRFRKDSRVGTAFHKSTSRRMTTNWYFNWDLCMVPDEFVNYAQELHAIRTNVAMADMSPLTKCVVAGPDACRALNYFVTRDIGKMEVGQVYYTPMCDTGGKLMSDALVFRETDTRYRVTADPVADWLAEFSSGFDITLEDVTDHFGILTLQGPRSRDVLEAATGQDWQSLNFSRLVKTRLGNIPIEVGRTGFTGELGYELCVSADRADDLWEAVEAAGAPFGIIPAGEQAVDIARVEAGLMIPGCDYGQSWSRNLPSGSHCKMARNQERLVSPYDLNCGAFVSLDKDFIGKAALQKEQADGGGRYDLLGLEIDWRAIVTHCSEQGIAPLIGMKVDWEGRNLCLNGKDCGWASSIVWSPTLKRMIAFAHIERHLALKIGDRVAVNWPVHGGTDGNIAATLVSLPFVELKRSQS
jgi:aminomethyltransferase